MPLLLLLAAGQSETPVKRLGPQIGAVARAIAETRTADKIRCAAAVG
jgi:hypothetical protein